jgi:tRNA pseudouridine55 synthase
MTDDAINQGLLLLDKPTGMTSHTAVRRASRAIGIKKGGHAGTLDPLATGLMLVGLGRATRLLEFLVGCDKTYLATIRLGESRDTLDREGELTRTCEVPDFSPEELEAVLAPLRGRITQTPPAYSAIKVDGVALHKRARRGEEFEVPKREVTIHRLEIVNAALPDLQIEVDCSSGTYIRSLARDIGDALGVGGSIWELRRTHCGDFSVEDALTLENLEALGSEALPSLLGYGAMLPGMPTVEIDDAQSQTIINGGSLVADAKLTEGDEIALTIKGGALIAIARVKDGRVKPRKVMA